MLLNCGVGEDLESPLNCKEIKPVNPKGNQSWKLIGRTGVEAEAPIFWPSDVKNWLIGKDPDAGKDWRQEEKGMTENEMVGWHHRHNGHEVWVGPRVGDGQGGLDERRPAVHGLTKIWTRLSDWIELMARAPPMEQISLLEFLPPIPRASGSFPMSHSSHEMAKVLEFQL